MNFTTESTVGIDTIIKDIQTDLYNGLVLSWNNNIDGYGRVYKNKTDSGFTAQYYISENDYRDVYVNDEKSGQFFFLTSNNSPTRDEYTFTNKTKVVFIVNLKQIFGDGRKDEEARIDAMQVLRDVAYGRFNIEGYEIGVEDVFMG